jgi:hypothetical protein
MYVSFGKLRTCRGFAPGQPWAKTSRERLQQMLDNGIGQKPL